MYSWRTSKLYVQKTAAIYFSKKLTFPNRITVNNNIIPWTYHTKYLGVTLVKILTCNKHFWKNIWGKFTGIWKSLSPLFKSNNFCIKNKALLYNAWIRSNLTYDCPILALQAKLIWMTSIENITKIFVSSGMVIVTSGILLFLDISVPLPSKTYQSTFKNLLYNCL